MASGDGFECCLKVGVWLYAVQLAGLDKRRDAGPGSATFVMADEQRVFRVEGKRHRETPWGVILPPTGIDQILRHSRDSGCVDLSKTTVFDRFLKAAIYPSAAKAHSVPHSRPQCPPQRKSGFRPCCRRWLSSQSNFAVVTKARKTHDYKRHGTTTLFAALEVKWGTVIGD
jgi:hypothetical protein